MPPRENTSAILLARMTRRMEGEDPRLLRTLTKEKKLLATDHDLDDLIVQAVCQAHADGVPIQAGKGPFYDKQLKKVFGIPHVHQSNICASVKHLLAAGVLLAEPTDEVRVSYGTERIKEYPVVRFLPA